jgi:hypothetical protein
MEQNKPESYIYIYISWKIRRYKRSLTGCHVWYNYVTAPASISEGPGFQSRSRYLPSLLGFLVVLISHNRQDKLQGVFKKRPNFYYKDFILQHFKHCPLQSSPLYWRYTVLKFLPLLECFLEGTFCDGAQFSYRIFLNLRVFKKRPNFLNSSPTSKEGALRLLSAPSGTFWQQTAICPVSLWALVVELHPLNWARAQAVRWICWLASYLKISVFFF